MLGVDGNERGGGLDVGRGGGGGGSAEDVDAVKAGAVATQGPGLW